MALHCLENLCTGHPIRLGAGLRTQAGTTQAESVRDPGEKRGPADVGVTHSYCHTAAWLGAEGELVSQCR